MSRTAVIVAIVLAAISNALDGRQYVAVASGGSFQIDSPRGDELLVFALPRTSSLPKPGRPTMAASGGRQ